MFFFTFSDFRETSARNFFSLSFLSRLTRELFLWLFSGGVLRFIDSILMNSVLDADSATGFIYALFSVFSMMGSKGYCLA
jgi:hypothetical protein